MDTKKRICNGFSLLFGISAAIIGSVHLMGYSMSRDFLIGAAITVILTMSWCLVVQYRGLREEDS
jgi:membrane protein implicated in regulation of membrane protease activity